MERKKERPEVAFVDMKLTVSLIITSFNRPEALDLVLKSILFQSITPDQIIIADDGSTKDTRETVRKYSARLNIVYAWQPDCSFRAARARNIAILRIDANYIIFVDGDCMLPPKFIETHLALSHPQKIVAGSRRLLNERQTTEVLQENKGNSPFFKHFKFLRFLRFTNSLRDASPVAWRSVRTCNFSLYKNAVLKVIGFDEEYIGWGLEDSDFVVRLIHCGFKLRSGRYATCVLHLWHQEVPRDSLSQNLKKFQHTLKSQRGLPSKSSIEIL